MQNNNRHTDSVHQEKGSTLVAAISLVTILTLAGFVLVSLTDNNARSLAVDVASARAFYAAQSGLEYGIRKSLTSGNWHWNASQQAIGSGSVTVVAEDSTLFPSLHDTLQVRVIGTYGGATSGQTFRMRLTDISGFAIYISGSLNDVTVRDSAGNPNPMLAREYATELPEMDTERLKQMAIAQGHYFSGSLSVSNGASYPTGNDANFYHPRPNGTPSDTPNVVYIEGNLEVKNSGQIFGIVVVQGDVTLKNSQKLEGVLYLPSPVSVVQQDVDLHNKETVYGGIFGGANVEGLGNENKINVYYRASYIRKFFGSYALSGMPYITIWRHWKQL